MDYWTLRNFFLAAPMIYAAVGRSAVHNFKAAQMSDLKEAQAGFRKAGQSGDADGLAIENNRFHEIIGEMSGNIYLLPSLKRLLIDHARIGHTFFRPRNADMRERMRLAVEHHDGLIEAIANHDEHAVVELVFEHWELSRKDIELFIAPEGLKADVLLDGTPA